MELENQGYKAEFSAIKKMEESYAGYREPVKFLMSMKDGKDRGILGTVSELFSVDNKLQMAMETALGGQLQNVVVEKDTDAKDLIEILKRERAGRITFLPLNRIEGRTNRLSQNLLNISGVFNLADKLIEFDEKYEKIFSDLLGATLVVDKLETALTLPKSEIKYLRIVTLEGEVLSQRGSITGGIESGNKTGLLSRRNKLTELSEKISEISECIEEMEEKISEKDTNLKEINKILTESQARGERMKSENEEEIGNLNRLSQELKTEEELLKLKEDELKDTEKNISILYNNLKTFNLDKETAEEKEKFSEEELRDIEVSMGEEAEKIESLNEKYYESVLKFKDLKNDLERLQSDKERLEKNIRESGNSKSDKAKELENCNNILIEKERRLKEDKLSLSRDEESLKLKEEDGRKIKKKSSILLEEIYNIQKQIEENSAFRNSFEKKTSDLKLKETRAEMQMESMRERIFSDYDCDIENIQQETFLESIKLMRERMEDLQVKIENLGSVNPNAIEEERKLTERLDLMKGQKDDLNQGKSDLNILITEIEEKMSKVFLTSMEEISSNFDMIFKKFFGGGSGSCSLTNYSNPLTSGIDITVNLPGKRKQSISLLSGGERALTAIALLFAIQRIKPNPFCILDEIDAALDEANIERFTNYLENSLDNIQFILVTHRKKTMEIAETIYGVTIDDDGVSKLLSMKLSER